MGMYIDVSWINEAYFNSKPCGTIFHCMQGTTHRSSSLNDTATSSPVSLQEAATQKVKVIRAFWIHNTSRSHDHSTPRSFLLVATTTSMQQSLSNRMRQLLGFFPTAFNYTFSYLFHVSHFTRFTQFLWASHVHPSPIHDCRLPTQSNDIRKAFSSLPARNGSITDHRQVLWKYEHVEDFLGKELIVREVVVVTRPPLQSAGFCHGSLGQNWFEAGWRNGPNSKKC